MEITEWALGELLARAPKLAPLARHRRPTRIRSRPPGLASLVQIVVEQAVSQRSANAVWTRIRAATPRVDAPSLLLLGDELRRCGLSRSKVGCILGLAAAVADGTLDLDALARAPDDEVRSSLTALRGVGRWTADVYLLLALERPDVWPAHDLALQEALRDVLALDTRPRAKAVDEFGVRLRPHRSAAAVLLWERYLEQRAHAPGSARARRT